MAQENATSRSWVVPLAIVLMLAAVVGGGVAWLRGGGTSADSSAVAESLSALGALVVVDPATGAIASVNLSTLKDKTQTDKAIDLATSAVTLRSLDLNRIELDARHAAPIGKLHELTSLSLKSTGIGDDFLAIFESLPRLESLHLNANPITNRGLETLVACESINVLDLSTTQVTQLAPVAKLPALEWLIVRDLELAAGALESLAEAPKLRRLTLRGSSFAVDDLAALQARRPELTIEE